MKIKKEAAIAAAFLTMANFSACDNVGSGVYGPPSETREYTETDMGNVTNEYNPQSESETNTDNSETTEEEYVQ